MPKTFDSSLLGVFSGKVGSTNNSDIEYSVNENVIKGNLLSTISPGQAVTVRLTLPEGDFVDASSNVDMFSIFVIILCVFLFL